MNHEEITLPRQIVLDMVKTVSMRRPTHANPHLEAAITTVADVGEKQGYRAARWLIDARSVWMIAYVSDASAVYEPGEQLDVALMLQNAVRETLEREAPATCRAMRKQVELGDITIDHPETVETQ